MLLAVLTAGALALASPAPCHGADISVTNMTVKVVKASSRAPGLDRVLITADMSNIGMLAQKPNIGQHAELLRNGKVAATQSFPALGAGITYPLQFRLFLDPATRKDPLQVLVRYVLDNQSTAPTENCSAVNDSLQKIF